MEWFESEDFWVNYGPIMFDDNRWAEAPAVAEYVKKIAKLENGAAVFDAGCGPGRISVELAILGLKVTGVDIIQKELDAARESAEDEGVKIEFINADLRSFVRPSAFDCAVNLFTSFGYCDTEEEDQLILKNIAASLKKDGTFILESTSREVAQLYFTEGEEFDRAGMHVITKFAPVDNWKGLRSSWTLISPEGKRLEHEFIQRLYSADELKVCCLKAGFSSAQVFGDFDFSPYDNKARTLVLVAKK